ncbi:MAG: hypothetical protein ACOH2F_11855 [Cellulomonas sp.]
MAQVVPPEIVATGRRARSGPVFADPVGMDDAAVEVVKINDPRAFAVNFSRCSSSAAAASFGTTTGAQRRRRLDLA